MKCERELEDSRKGAGEVLRKDMDALTAPRRPRPRAEWHDTLTPKIIDLVRERGYACCRDAELLGLHNTIWHRCLTDIRKREPTWSITIIKHVKYLHRPDFDPRTAETSAFTIGNCTATDPKLLQLLVSGVLKARWLNVLSYLKEKAPERSSAWREQVLDALSSYSKEKHTGIEREYVPIGRIMKRSDWFIKRP